MAQSNFDRDSWEKRWSSTLMEHADKLAQRAANAQLVRETVHLKPGRALDAGCGHGAEALWLAARDWQVTAVDFSPAALAYGRATAEAAGANIAQRIDWLEADLATWRAQPEHYDLVVCLYVHVTGSVTQMVQRMANGVAPGGSLLLVGHRPIDPKTGAATAAANQIQVSVEAVVAQRNVRALLPAAGWMQWFAHDVAERPRPFKQLDRVSDPANWQALN
jgi:2-polyprenyl-3-methyl-5-hydroxy-6-metoxy-1,4-benzoquinol methylase